ncbi:hypothetical protein GOP47_0015994, partial [Adiantum capillus-veneris]
THELLTLGPPLILSARDFSLSLSLSLSLSVCVCVWHLYDVGLAVATLGVSCPSLSICKSSFLPVRAFKVEAKKGEWLPGLASPAYLDENLASDNGFDPLGLAKDPANLKWYVQAELQNGRWAILGVAGMLIPDLLTKIGVINVPAWYDAARSSTLPPPPLSL